MVESLYFVPAWFYQFDIALGVLFALVTAIVAVYSNSLYKIAKEREFRLFSISFAMLSLSYIMRIGLNAFLTSLIDINQGILRLSDINLISKASIYAYVFLFIGSYVTFAYTTLKVKGNRAYLLMLIPSMIAFTFSWNKSLTLYLITALFLLAILYHYARIYAQTQQPKIRAMLIAVTLLLASNIIFMFVADYQFYYGYIISSSIELCAYALIAFTLYQISKHGKKTH